MANYAQSNYYAGQAAAQAGKPPQTNTNHPEYSYWIQGYNDYINSQNTRSSTEELMSSMSEMFAPMEFPEIPEIDYDKVIRQRGMNITFVTTAKADEEAQALLAELGMPFAH